MKHPRPLSPIAGEGRGEGKKPLRWLSSLGLTGLVIFLGALEALFLREARDGRAQLSETRRALEHYATVTLTRAVDDELTLARARVAEVEADPLRDERGLVLVRDGRVLLPRASADSSRGVQARVEALEAGAVSVAADEDGPWAERVRLLDDLRGALARKDTKAIEAAVRASLSHRVHWVLPPDEDLAATVALLQVLSRTQRPAPELMRRVLRDGFSGEAPVEGLQRQVLRAWGKLGADDSAFLCGRVVALSRASAVPASDFEAACARAGKVSPPPVPDADGTWARFGAAPLVLRAAAGEVVGTTMPASLAAGLAGDLRERGLLQPEDTLTVAWASPRESTTGNVDPARAASNAAASTGSASLGASSPGASSPGASPSGASSSLGLLSAVRVSLQSPRLEAAERALSERLASKTALALVTLLLGVGVVVAAGVAQGRRARYLALQSDFVSTVSHELRTPLASMRVMAETLERKLAGHAPAKDYPARLVQTVDGLTFLVENILSFNRVEKGRWQVKRAPVALAAVRAVLEDDAAHAQGVEVRQTFTGFDDVVLDADGELLRILFRNLLRNAWKYNERAPVTLRWEAARAGDAVVVRVTDNGVGIPEAAWDSVFEAFHRLRDGRGRGGGGSGLGLALGRRIAELHGGSLRVAASSLEGTTFELVFPLPHRGRGSG